MSGRWPGWSHLPPELLQVIAQDHLTSAIDIVRLRCVCSSWRSAIAADLIPPQLPWLLLPHHQQTPSLSFFSPSDQTLLTLTLPNSDWKSVFASAHGYLLLLQNPTDPLAGLAVSLFNPINKHLIHFPPLPPELKSPFIRKAVIGLSPAPLVAVWVYKKLAFCVLGKPDWRVVDVEFSYAESQCDLAYHNGYLYLATRVYLQVFNLKLSKKMSRSHRLYLANMDDSSLHFVVSASSSSSLGILLLLVRYGSARAFMGYRVDRSRKGVWSLVRQDVSGDNLFFLSNRNSACVPAEGVSGWEERRGCYASEKFVEGGVAPEIHLATGGKDGFSLGWSPDHYYWRAPRAHWADWKDITGITWFLPKLR